MTRSLITLTVFVTLACTAALGCSSEPIVGEPGAACLPRVGETTPLYCVCGYPCVDGMCVEDPDISCGEALATPEPDITVEADTSDATSDATSDDAVAPEDADVTEEVDTLAEDATSDVVEGDVSDEEVSSSEVIEDGDTVDEATSDADAASTAADVETSVEETAAEAE